MKISTLQTRCNQSFKATYKDSSGNISNISQKAIDEIETSVYIRRRLEEKLKREGNAPRHSTINFIISDHGACLLIPNNFGKIRYAGHLTTGGFNPEKPREIYTTQIDANNPKKYYDSCGLLENNGHTWAHIQQDYRIRIVNPEKAPKD